MKMKLPKWRTIGSSTAWIIFAIFAVIVANLASDYATRTSLKAVAEENARDNTLIGTPLINDGRMNPLKTVVVGQPFFVWHVYHRSETCRYIIQVSLSSGPENNYDVATVKNSEGWLPAGDERFNELLVIPKGVLPGHYHLKKRVVNICGEPRGTFYSQTYDLPIDVVAAPTTP